MDVRQTNCHSRHKGGGHLGGFRGSTFQKFGKAVRLAPTLVHVCGFIWEWTYAKSKSPLNTPGGMGGGGCHTFKCLENLTNVWTNWHQIWYKSADSSGNGHRLKTIRPSISQGAFWGGFRGSQIQKYVEAVKRLHRLAPNLAYMCRFIWEWIYAKQIALRDTRVALGG